MKNSAVLVLREIEAQGGQVRIEGERLRIRAPRPLPAPLMEKAKAARRELLALLSGTAWDGEDWLTWITERAAILEYDGELPRAEADRRAYEHAIIEWLNRHPYQGDPGQCAGCGDPIRDQANDWRPLADGATVHYGGPWGLRCLDSHSQRRRGEAATRMRDLLASCGGQPAR